MPAFCFFLFLVVILFVSLSPILVSVTWEYRSIITRLIRITVITMIIMELMMIMMVFILIGLLMGMEMYIMMKIKTILLRIYRDLIKTLNIISKIYSPARFCLLL